MSTAKAPGRQRLVRRGQAEPRLGDEAIVQLLPDGWVSFQQLQSELAARELLELYSSAWFLPFDESALVWPLVCSSVPRRRLEEAVAAGLLEEQVIIHPRSSHPWLPRLGSVVRQIRKGAKGWVPGGFSSM